MGGAAPSSCTVCGTSIPEGAQRCPGCGAVWGEDNRCPHCHALAGVRAGAGGWLCMACGKPREKKDGTTVVGGPPAPGGAVVAPAPAASAARGKSTGLRLLGILGVAGGVLAATAAAMVIPGVGGVVVAAALGATGVGLGGWAIRAGSRAGEVASTRTTASRELQILELAEEKGGVLTVTDVARGLGMSSAEADAALTSMADGSRVSAELTTDGFVKYVFRELRALKAEERARSGAPRVRVDAADAADVEDEVAGRSEELAEAYEEVEAFLDPRPEREREG